MRALSVSLILGLVPATTALVACDDNDGGDDVTAVKAQITKGDVTDPSGLEILLAWSNTAGSPDVGGATDRHALAADPKSFTLALDAAPPAALMNDYTHGGLRPKETKIGIAVIAVAPVGFDPTGEAEPAVLGVSSQYVVAWVDSDIQAGTFSAELVGGALKRGFHLLKSIPAEEYLASHPEIAKCDEFDPACELPDEPSDTAGMKAYFECYDKAAAAAGCLGPGAIFDRLVPATDGFATPIDIELHADPDAAEAPNWT